MEIRPRPTCAASRSPGQITKVNFPNNPRDRPPGAAGVEGDERHGDGQADMKAISAGNSTFRPGRDGRDGRDGPRHHPTTTPIHQEDDFQRRLKAGL